LSINLNPKSQPILMYYEENCDICLLQILENWIKIDVKIRLQPDQTIISFD
jgi:hypothetical protein